MNYILSRVSFIVNAVLIGVVLFLYNTMQKTEQVNSVTRIAILTPVTHPSLEQIEHGFVKTLTNEGKQKYDIKVFNAQGDRKLMHAQAEEIVQADFDAVFTIATGPSVMVHELLAKRGKKTPQVFGAVSDPVGIGLVASLEHPGLGITGTVEAPDFEKQITYLKLLKPDAQKVLMVYNPTQGSGLVKDKDCVESLLTSRGMALQTVEVVNVHEIYGKVVSAIADCDVVMVLKDNTVVSGLDSLVKLCTMHNKTLLATDLDSGDRGAAISFGVHEDQYGVYAARLVHTMLESGNAHTEFACVPPGLDRCKINVKAAQTQNVILTETQKILYPVVELIEG